MVISHKYKYVFVGSTRTASTAISNELCEHYAGKKILRNQSSYDQFLKIATQEEKNYFVFAAVRNPMDRVTSQFVRMTNKQRDYLNPPRKQPFITQKYLQWKFLWVQKHKPDFFTFFKKFYKLPYNDYSMFFDKHIDHVLHFENLEDDFNKTLKILGIKPVRPLPFLNTTKAKKKSFYDYYTHETRNHAIKIYGPFIKKWNYKFPEDWGEISISSWTNIKFKIVSLLKLLYYKYQQWVEIKTLSKRPEL